MPSGQVKFFNERRGFGFIERSDGGGDVFVRSSALQRAGLKTLVTGQRVTFDTAAHRKGGAPKAVNLVVIDANDPRPNIAWARRPASSFRAS